MKDENKRKAQPSKGLKSKKNGKKLETTVLLKNTPEETLRAMINAPMETAMLVDMDGRVMAVNDIAAERLKVDPKKLIGLDMFEYLPANVANSRKKYSVKVAQTKKPIRFQDERDGRFFDNNIYPVFDTKGNVNALAIYAKDITEIKEAEITIKESEKRYSSLFSATNEGVALHEIIYNKSGKPVDYKILDVNPAFERLVGIKNEDAVGSFASELYQSGEAPYLEIYSRVAETGKPRTFEATFKPLSKSFKISAFSPGKGQFATLFADITERKQAEEALHESEEKFSKLFQTSPNILVISLLQDGRIIDMNPQGFEKLGYERDEIIGKTRDDLTIVDPEDVKKLIEMIKKEGYYSGVELKARLKDGSERYGLFYGQLIQLGGENLLFQTIVDLTERKQAEEELKDSEIKYRTLFENANDAIFLVDPETGKVVDCNPLTLKIFGYKSKKEFLGKTAWELSPPIQPDGSDSEKKGWEIIRTCVDDGMYPLFEWIHQKKDGTQIITEVSLSCETLGDKMLFQAIIRDITERKKAEEKLKESEEKFSKAFYSGPDSISISTLEDGKYVDVNEAFCFLSGYKKEETIGKTSVELNIWKDKKDRLKLTEMLEKNGHVKNFELELMNKEGETVYVLTSVEMIEYESKPHLLTIVKDISDRKKAEEELRGSEDKYRSLVEHIPDVTWTSDQNGRTTFISPNVEKIYGYTPEEIYKAGEKLWFGRIHHDDVSRVKKEYNTLQKKGTPLDIEYRIERKDGEWIWLQDRSIGTYEKDGIIFADGVFFDVTERKNAEIALKESEEKFSKMFQASPNLMSLFDFDTLKQIDVNDSFIKITGYTRAEAIDTTINVFDMFENPQRAEETVKLLIKEKSVKNVELRIRTKFGEERVFLYSGEVIEIGGKDFGLVVAEDITERKKNELEMKRRLMKYDLEDGNLYLVQESTSNKSYVAFNDLLKVGYNGNILSRTPKEKLLRPIKLPFDYMWLAEAKKDNSIKPNLKELESWVKKLPPKQAILIDRLDYLISKLGFKNTLTLVHRLRELSYINSHTTIINLDPETIETKQLKLLAKECLEIEPMVQISLPGDLLDVLKSVYEMNIVGVKPKYAKIEQELKLSKPTVRKRIKDLVYRGLVMESPKGSSKVVELTEKGKSLFLK